MTAGAALPRPVPGRRVAITAAGVVSPLGIGLEENAAALRAGRDAVTPVTAFDVSQTRCKNAGQVDDARLAEVCARQERRLHRASRMLIAAARELAVQTAGLPPDLLVVGTTSGGMSFGEAFHRQLLAHRFTRQRAAWLANYAPQKMVLDAMQSCRVCAPVQIVANACASGTNAIGHAFRLVRAGLCHRVWCGGFDALCELVFVGFDALQVATPGQIRPFDRDRNGLVLGEGAALLALEDWDAAQARGATVLGAITGYGIATDTHHLTQPHPSGAAVAAAMEQALADARRTGSEVDYVNAHGTGTPLNDASEGLAISRICPGVPVSSTKSMMGHALGAAGAIEAVFCLLALRDQLLPPNLHFLAPDPGWTFEVVGRPRLARIGCVLSNSIGFGGTNASIVIEKT